MLLLVGSAHDAGDDNFYADVLSRATRVIAVDAGAELCNRLGRVPDLAVGDWDSAGPQTMEWLAAKGVALERLPVHKDATDLEVALDRAADIASEDEIVLTAVLGRRLDHTLATIGAMAARPELRLVAHEPRESAWVLAEEGRRSLSLEPEGATFSVMSLAESSVVTIGGARYPLEARSLAVLAPVGVSNVVSEASATVIVERGLVLLITPTDTDITRATECGSS